MKLENLDALDCSLFLLLASAEVTDHYLTESEIDGILEKAGGLSTRFNLTDNPITYIEVRQKFRKAFDAYNHIGESAPEGKMNTHIKERVFEVAHFMKGQVWFSLDFAQALLNDLVDLAAVDGETIKNEQQLINRIADDWNLSQPFS